MSNKKILNIDFRDIWNAVYANNMNKAMVNYWHEIKKGAGF